MIGGLFSHDKVSARASGKYADGPELASLPAAPPTFGALPPRNPFAPSAQAPAQSAPLDVSGLEDNRLLQARQLPQAPPRKPSLFDDEHRRETFLAIAAGMMQGQNFGDGLGAAAQNLLGLQRGLKEEGRPQIGGPDNAFEVYTNDDGTHRYVPIQAVRDYRAEQAALEADLKSRRPDPAPKDNLDAWGRLASVVSKLPVDQQAQGWQAGREQLASLGYVGIPETYNPAYREYGGPVPVMTRADTGVVNANERKRHNGVMETFTGAKVAQGGTRVDLAVRASRRADLKAAESSDGYEYRTVNGKIQRRKIR